MGRTIGDEMIFDGETGAARLVQAGLWFFVAAVAFMLSLLPLTGDGRHPYPWGSCSVLWIFAAGAVAGGLVQLKTRTGTTFNRARRTVSVWTVLFGRRREKTRPLATYTAVHVTTGLTRRRGTTIYVRWHALELRGPEESLPLKDVDPWQIDRVAKPLAEFLGLQSSIEDRNPGDRIEA